jgi:rubrerythrin
MIMKFQRVTPVCTTFALCLAAAVFFFSDELYSQSLPSVAISTETQKIESVTNQPSQTLENLLADYTTEMNGKDKYAVYARQADKEGYHKVAELFRAAARSLETHANLHAKAINEFGEKPSAVITTPVARTTKENLKESIKTETEEIKTLYPVHLAQAKADGAKTAVISFRSGIQIGTNRQKYFKDALGRLSAWKNTSSGFFVCTVCGNLVDKPDFAECPVCKSPVSVFVQVK